MSAEAWRLVMDHSSARGAGLIALLTLADTSPDRGNFPKSRLPLPAWAKKCRCSERSLTVTVQKLLSAKKLTLLEPAHGHVAPLYEINVGGVKKTWGLGVKKTTPLIREDPLSELPRAEFQCTDTSATPVVLPFPRQFVTYPKARRGK